MLREIVAYTETRVSGSEPGFTVRNLRWCIDLSSDGRFLNVLPLGDEKRGLAQSRCPDMHGMNAGGKSHFLIENAKAATLLFKDGETDEEIAKFSERHRYYAKLLNDASKSVTQLSPIADLVSNETNLEGVREALRIKKAKPEDWITWRVGGHDLASDNEVQSWWRAWRQMDLNQKKEVGDSDHNNKMVCLLTAEPVVPLERHPKIVGLAGIGGMTTGDILVGFDKDAFVSYGLSNSSNAAMSAESAQKYVDGLNDLIRNRSYKLANTLVVHWFKEFVPPEEDLLDFIHEPPGQTEASALSVSRKLLDSIRSGQRPDLLDNTFYAITISGAAGRVMVRDWMTGGFEELLKNIVSWFDDLSIVAREGNRLASDPKFMAVCGALVRELKDLSAPITATLWRAAIQGTPIPQSLMIQALARFRSDLVNKDQPPFNHARMGLIKAYFVRKDKRRDKNMTAYLNPDHPEPAYHCGRLLALLANLQRAALGDVGAGVVQRYYAAASQSPGLIMGRLISNAKNHLGKLEPGLAWWYEERLANIMNRLGDRIPSILTVEGQGLFALGYYQQLADLRSGNASSKTTTKSEKEMPNGNN